MIPPKAPEATDDAVRSAYQRAYVLSIYRLEIVIDDPRVFLDEQSKQAPERRARWIG